MASNAKSYFKFVICLVLLTTLECRVIKIVDEAEDSNDVIIKVIIKHSKKNTHKLNNDHGIESSGKKELNDKASDGFSSNTDTDKDSMNKKFELPDNLFEDLEDTSNAQTSSKEDIKEAVPEPIPSFQSRSGIQVGYCPSGYIRRGRFCLPADK